MNKFQRQRKWGSNCRWRGSRTTSHIRTGIRAECGCHGRFAVSSLYGIAIISHTPAWFNFVFVFLASFAQNGPRIGAPAQRRLSCRTPALAHARRTSFFFWRKVVGTMWLKMGGKITWGVKRFRGFGGARDLSVPQVTLCLQVVDWLVISLQHQVRHRFVQHFDELALPNAKTGKTKQKKRLLDAMCVNCGFFLQRAAQKVLAINWLGHQGGMLAFQRRLEQLGTWLLCPIKKKMGVSLAQCRRERKFIFYFSKLQLAGGGKVRSTFSPLEIFPANWGWRICNRQPYMEDT